MVIIMKKTETGQYWNEEKRKWERDILDATMYEKYEQVPKRVEGTELIGKEE